MADRPPDRPSGHRRRSVPVRPTAAAGMGVPPPRLARSGPGRCGRRRAPVPSGPDATGRGGCPQRRHRPRIAAVRQCSRTCPRSRFGRAAPPARLHQAAGRRPGRRRRHTPAESSDPADRRHPGGRAVPVVARRPDCLVRRSRPAATARPHAGPCSRRGHPAASAARRSRPSRVARRLTGPEPCAQGLPWRAGPGDHHGPAGGFGRTDRLQRRPRIRNRRRLREDRTRSAGRRGRKVRCPPRSPSRAADRGNRREQTGRRNRPKWADRRNHRERADRRNLQPQPGGVLDRPGSRARAAGGFLRAGGRRARGGRRPNRPVAHRPSPDDLRF